MNKTETAIELFARNFDAFLDNVKAALPESTAKKGAKSVQPLAAVLGVRDAQVYEWVITRKYSPAGPMAFRMLAWLIQNQQKG